MSRLLSEKKIDKLWEEYEKNDPMQAKPFDNVIAQAQRDSSEREIAEAILKCLRGQMAFSELAPLLNVNKNELNDAYLHMANFLMSETEHRLNREWVE